MDYSEPEKINGVQMLDLLSTGFTIEILNIQINIDTLMILKKIDTF